MTGCGRKRQFDFRNSGRSISFLRGWGQQSLSACFVDFLHCGATTSNVCFALTPVIHAVGFLKREWPDLAVVGPSRRPQDHPFLPVVL